MFRRAAPKSAIYLLKGNHENRRQNFLWTAAPELAGLTSLELPKLLELDKFKIQWIEEGAMLHNGLLVKHGNIVRQHACYSARAELERNGISGISGHTHRLGQIFKTDFGGNYTWVEAGCLCKTTDVEYAEGQKLNWQQGIAVGFFKKDSGRFSVSPLPIVHGKLLFDLKEFSGDDMPKMSKRMVN